MPKVVLVFAILKIKQIFKKKVKRPHAVTEMKEKHNFQWKKKNTSQEFLLCSIEIYAEKLGWGGGGEAQR